MIEGACLYNWVLICSPVYIPFLRFPESLHFAIFIYVSVIPDESYLSTMAINGPFENRTHHMGLYWLKRYSIGTTLKFFEGNFNNSCCFDSRNDYTVQYFCKFLFLTRWKISYSDESVHKKANFTFTWSYVEGKKNKKEKRS